MHPKATLICFEINDNFYNQLLDLKHPQLVVLKKSAENIEKELKKLKLNKVNHVVSSIPLTILPDEVSDEILQESYKILDNNGTFIQYQYSLSYFKKLKKVFKESISLEFEPLNIPPAFIYRCKKVE